MAIPTILKGETAKPIRLALAEGYDYAGCSLHVEFCGTRKTFSDLAAGGNLELRFTAEQTAAFPLGTSRAMLSLENANGEIRFMPWAKIKVTDSPADLYDAQITIDPASLDVDDLTAGDSLGVVKTKLQAVIDFLRGLKVLAVCALPFFALADVEPLYTTPNDMPGDAPLMTNTAAYVDAKVAEIPAPDYSTSNAALVETIEATAPAPGNYAAVSNAAVNAAITNALQDAAISTISTELANKADATVAVQKQWNGPHLPEACFPIVFYQGTTRREIRSPSELSWVRNDDMWEIDMYCDDPTGEYSEGLFYIATFLNVRREGTYYYSMFGNVAVIEIDGETMPLLWFNGREPVGDNDNGFPALVNPGTETNHYGVVYSNAFSSAVADLHHTLADKTKAAEQSLAEAKEMLGESLDRKADKVIIEYAYGANTNSYWVADWNGERLNILYGDGVDDGSMRWGGETISLEWDAELQSALGYGWTLEVGYDREYGSEFTATASGTATSDTLEFSNFTITRHWLREQTPVSTNVVQYVTWGVDTTDGRYYIDFEE